MSLRAHGPMPGIPEALHARLEALRRARGRDMLTQVVLALTAGCDALEGRARRWGKQGAAVSEARRLARLTTEQDAAVSEAQRQSLEALAARAAGRRAERED